MRVWIGIAFVLYISNVPLAYSENTSFECTHDEGLVDSSTAKCEESETHNATPKDEAHAEPAKSIAPEVQSSKDGKAASGPKAKNTRRASGNSVTDKYHSQLLQLETEQSLQPDEVIKYSDVPHGKLLRNVLNPVRTKAALIASRNVPDVFSPLINLLERYQKAFLSEPEDYELEYLDILNVISFMQQAAADPLRHSTRATLPAKDPSAQPSFGFQDSEAEGIANDVRQILGKGLLSKAGVKRARKLADSIWAEGMTQKEVRTDINRNATEVTPPLADEKDDEADTSIAEMQNVNDDGPRTTELADANLNSATAQKEAPIGIDPKVADANPQPVPNLPDAPAKTEVAQPDERFDIDRIVVEGNTLLPTEKVEQLVAPFAGKRKVYGDVQRALEALEVAYRAAGFNTVEVYLPEQELKQGFVKLTVTEGIIGKIKVTGNQHFTEENVRAALPALKEGTVPNALLLSENIQLSNDNPAKQVEVVLGVGEEENRIDVKINVKDEDPQKFIATLDNTGTAATGKHRIGVAYQNANMLQSDHTMTLAYTTAPDAPKGVSVDIFSVAYHLPLYRLGDSIDLIYGNSNVNTPTVQSTGFGMIGKGDVTSVRFNHYFPRQGEYSSKLAVGLDYKYFNTRCSIGGVQQAIDPQVLASCTPYTTRPISATYSGQWQGAGAMTDYSLGAIYNLPLGSSYPFQGRSDHYSQIAGRPVSDHFTAMRFGGSAMATVLTDWQARLAVSGQYSNGGLLPGEQFGLAGSTAVRGFNERAVAADSGHLVNLEAYTPDLATALSIPGNLRGLLFYDFARGKNIRVVAPTPLTAESVGIAAAGFGLRYNIQKYFSVRADIAEVEKGGPLGTEGRGDWRGHFNMSLSY